MDKPSILEMFAIRCFLIAGFLAFIKQPYLKIACILLLDGLKIGYLFIKSIYSKGYIKEGDLATNPLYQRIDKCIDIIGYLFVQLLICKHNLFIESQRNILFIVLSIRIIGVILYLYTNKSNYLFFFPDVYKEWLCLFFVFESSSVLPFLLVGTLIAKLVLEYQFHIIKTGGRIIVPLLLLFFLPLLCFKLIDTNFGVLKNDI